MNNTGYISDSTYKPSMAMQKLTVLVILRTLVSRLLVALLFILYMVPGIILLLVPKRWRYDNRVYYWFAHFFYWALIKCSFSPVTFKGRQNIPSGPVIFVANHQSALDIPLVGLLANCYPHIWLATTWLLSLPLLRFSLPRIAVLIDMSTPMKGMRSLLKAITMIYDKKRHAIIFPEGTRYADDNVHEFYGGFVILAKKTGRPVVPVRIFHANKVYPRDTFWVQYHPITVVVGKPFIMQEGERDEVFKQRVYQWFLEQKVS